MKTFLLILLVISALLTATACKKCITCRAQDASSGELKYEETSCAKGPLLDDWQEGVRAAYPEPVYNTVCK